VANIDDGRVASDCHAKSTTLAFSYSLHTAFSFANTSCLPSDLLPLLFRDPFISRVEAVTLGIVLVIDKFIDTDPNKVLASSTGSRALLDLELLKKTACTSAP
jgi:hypothetical protein